MSERVSVGSWPRRTLAGWLRRLADRLAPEREIRVHLTADTAQFERAVREAAEGLRRLTKQPASHVPGWSRDVQAGDKIEAPPKRGRGSDTSVPSSQVRPPHDSGATRTRPDPPPPQPNRNIVTGPERRSPS